VCHKAVKRQSGQYDVCGQYSDADNAERRRLGFVEVGMDTRLVAALEHSLPAAAGSTRNGWAVLL